MAESVMNTYQCRRGKHFQANSDKTVVKNVITYDERRGKTLFPECKECGYGSERKEIVGESPPFQYTEFKTCLIRMVV